MRKGGVPLLFLLGALIVLGEFIYARHFMIKTSVLAEVGRENELITAMDEIEIFKRYLNKIIQFSYCGSNDEAGTKDMMIKYANIYGINLDFQTLETVSYTHLTLPTKA